ncbi:MAG TPA: adenylate/guanylate cyclase domain-containing protein, partial [Candidatus Binatia bacterium]|nr:adenylate/guanylate cyclase domain-containing protein [Candidatus Binatia bacterium]
MRCPSCGFANPEGLKFCNECGTALKRRCAQCGFENTPQAKFCGECGTTLGAAGQPPPAKSRSRKSAISARKASRPATSPLTARAPSASPGAERRQLTVMFCDLVDSTALSEQLDPEEWREVVRAYQGTCAEVVNHYDGHIAQYLGDGLLVYFGYPIAHEDDAQRAARAGLEIITAFRHRLPAGHEVPSPLAGERYFQSRARQQAVSSPLPYSRGSDLSLSSRLQVRIGIHTGLVVVGEIGEGSRREQLALGDTPNIAARLQGLAQPNAVVISAATHRLIAGLLDCQDLGSHSLKGVSTPLQIYQVVGDSGARSRLDVALTTGLTPLVGREEEVALLFKRWEQAKAGDGQVVMLNGEAGIGKSRLVQVLKEHLT